MLPQVAPEVGATINKSDRFSSADLRITSDARFKMREIGRYRHLWLMTRVHRGLLRLRPLLPISRRVSRLFRDYKVKGIRPK